MRHMYQVNLEPSAQTKARMELLMHEVGVEKVSVVWNEFLRTHKFGDIDDAWANFEEWLHGTMENVSALVGIKLTLGGDGLLHAQTDHKGRQ